MSADESDVAIEDYCGFDENRVYLFLAIARTKENPSLSSGSDVVFREVITDTEDIHRKYQKLQAIATGYRDASGERLTFRLYLTVNPRNTWDAYFNFRSRMNGWAEDQIRGDDAVHQKLKRVDRYWHSELQKPGARDESRFLFDLDDASENDLHRLRSTLEEQTAVVVCQETPNGYHIVTAPFNHTELETDVEYELKTDGLLFLEYLSSHDDMTSARE